MGDASKEYIDSILKKDGNQWTPDERKAISQFIANGGREALKARRKELRA